VGTNHLRSRWTTLGPAAGDRVPVADVVPQDWLTNPLDVAFRLERDEWQGRTSLRRESPVWRDQMRRLRISDCGLRIVRPSFPAIAIRIDNPQFVDVLRIIAGRIQGSPSKDTWWADRTSDR